MTFSQPWREYAYMLRGEIQMNDAYLGGERSGGKAGRRSENKIIIFPVESLIKAWHPIHAKIMSIAGFSSDAVAAWAREHLALGCTVLSDGGLVCFRSVTTAGCSHGAIVTQGLLEVIPRGLLTSRALTTPTA